jgi:hypothetical protein
MSNVVFLVVSMFSIIILWSVCLVPLFWCQYALCRYYLRQDDQCHYSKRQYAQCHYVLFPYSLVMLSVIVLRVLAPSNQEEPSKHTN